MEQGMGRDRGLGSAPTALRAAKIPFFGAFPEDGCPRNPQTLRPNPLRAAGRAKSGCKPGRNRGEAGRGGKGSGAENRELARSRSCSSDVRIMQPFHGTLRSQFATRLRGEIGHIIPLNNKRSGRLI